jgi:hypothetical protein
MSATVQGAVRELLEQTMITIDTVLATSDDELTMPSSRMRARQGPLDADHERHQSREDPYRAGARGAL